MNETEIEDLKSLVRKAESFLSSSADVKECLYVLEDVKSRLLLTSGRRLCSSCHIYAQFADFLLQQLHTKWYKELTEDQRSEMFDDFFLKGFPEQIFLVLMNVISVTSPSDKLDKALDLLKKFVKSSAVNGMFLVQCVPLEDSTLNQEVKCEIWDELVSYLISLPERVANKLRLHEIQDIFRTPVYFCKIVDVVIWCLVQIRSQIDLSIDCSLQFLSRLVGRSCLSGHSDVMMSPLIEFLSQKTSDDFVWRRISRRVFIGIPANCLENVMTYLFRTVAWYKIVSRLIGNAVADNPKLNYLLTHKLLLIRSFEETLVLKNILGYLSDDEQHRPLFVKVFLNLLDVWGNKSNLKHRPYKQHVYITSAILISLSFMNDTEKLQNKEAILPKLMHAMDSHLSSPIPDIRKLGMFTAKNIVKVVNPNGPQLQFEYEHDNEVEDLEKLLIPPCDSTVDQLSVNLKTVAFSDHVTEEVGQESHTLDHSSVPQSEASKELDSDDDLEPYDMSIDTKIKKYNKPRYLRDCIEGLLEQNDADRMEASLEACEHLIRSNPIGVDDAAVEMAKVLLHLDDRFCTKNFILLRFGALTAITVTCPKLVAEYLSKQFYDRNYSLRQRMDILEVLVGAAQELSKPAVKTSTKAVTKSIIPVVSPLPTTENWQSIVQKRIELKTRRFAKGCSQANVSLVPNRFAPSAGHFFFPLIRYGGHQTRTFDILDSDFVLLGRFIYSLGMIVYAAVNTPIAFHMGQELLQFLWIVRFHTQPYIRRALIFSLCMSILSVPPHHFIDSLQEIIEDYEDWLKDVVRKDSDDDCVRLAGQCLALIRSTLKEVN